jgi:acetate kinase
LGSTKTGDKVKSTISQEYRTTDMYKNTDKDFVGAAITAALGAGIVTSFAVNQGQDIGTALGITSLAALCGVICRYFDIL